MEAELRNLLKNRPSILRNSLLIVIVWIVMLIAGLILMIAGIWLLIAGNIRNVAAGTEFSSYQQYDETMFALVSGSMMVLIGFLFLCIAKLCKMILRRNAWMLEVEEVVEGKTF